MLKKIILIAFAIVPGLGISQSLDTAPVIRQVDSLLQVSRTLTGQRDFDSALELTVSAEKLALEKLGRETAAYGSCCHNHGRVLHYKGDYPEAEKWYHEAIAIREKALGKEHPDYAASLSNMATLNSKLGQFDKAESLFLESIAIREKTQGKHHPDYATSLNNLGNMYFNKGDNEKAEPLLLEAKAIQEKILVKEHPEYGRSLNNLANVYSIMGHYEKAEPLRLEAKAIMEKTLGKENPDYASSLNNLAVLYWNMGLYEKAENLHLEAISIREKTLGKEHMDYAASLNNLAVLYKDMGDYEKAEHIHLQDLTLREKIFGKEHPGYGKSLNSLANLYREMGVYEKIEPLYLEAKAIHEKALGRDHRDYATSLNNLAILYSDMGSYKEAEPLYLEAKNILEKSLGKDHPAHISVLNNLAVLYGEMENYERAQELYLEANALLEKALGKEHPDYAGGLNNLAVLYSDMGDYGKAEPLYLECKAIREKVLGKDHPDYAASLDNLTNLYVNMGDYGKAEMIYLEAKAIREKSVGKEHPKYAASLTNLANLYMKIGDYEKAEPLFDELAYLHQFMLTSAIHFLSERELNNYLNKFSESQAAILSFAQTTAGKGTRIHPVCYDNILFYKGFLLNTANQLKRLALSDSIATEKHNQLKSYERRLAAEYTKPITERKIATDLEIKANDLEKELARTVTGYGEAMRQVRWQEVQLNLQPGEVTVEFIHYKYYGKTQSDSIMYAALVLRHDDVAPHFIPLFEEREIALLLKSAKGGNFLKINALYAFQPEGSGQKSLYDLIWKPLEAPLQGVKAVYCSPSGLLHQVNLGAIPVEGNKLGETFAQRYQLVLLGSTRQLVIPNTTKAVGNNGYIAGGVRYEIDSADINTSRDYSLASVRGIALADELPIYSDSTYRGGSWSYLPGTAIEASDLSRILQSVKFETQTDTGFLATEESFKSLGLDKPSPRVLHIATHGFFFPKPKKAVSNRPLAIDSEPVFKMSEHPMIRSGLILAGAQQAWTTSKEAEDREDGILTAYEISQMNLSNSELVVLSACETGLGDIEGNEGVYGLQRAFKIAGAKYLIMSLWKVNDQSTRELMTDFYRQWLEKGLTIPYAFRMAQQNIKAKYKDPYHWAGFVLVE